MEKHFFILAVVILSILWGCSSSPLSRYPDFVMKKSQISSGLVMTDVAIVEHVRGGKSKVDIVENTKTAQMCLNVLAGTLNEKGYHIDRTLVASMGMVMNSNDVYKIVRNENEKDEDVHSLDDASPPFYINTLLFSDSISQRQLQALYLRLLYSNHKKDEPPVRIPEAGLIGKRLGGGLIFMLFVNGINVPASSQNGNDTKDEDVLSTKIAVQYTTQVSTVLYVLDSETGEIVWDDRVIKQGGIIHREKVFEMLHKLLEELP